MGPVAIIMCLDESRRFSIAEDGTSDVKFSRRQRQRDPARRIFVEAMRPGARAKGTRDVREKAFTTEHGHVALLRATGVTHEYQSDSSSKGSPQSAAWDLLLEGDTNELFTRTEERT